MFNLREIMLRAWRIYRKGDNKLTFAESLHRAWTTEKAKGENERRVAAAKEEAGVVEEVKTWKQWKDAGYEVQHGSTSLFKVLLIWGSRGDDAEYCANFFGFSQVQPIA